MPFPPQNVTNLPERVALGITFGPSVDSQSRRGVFDRAAIVEIPIASNDVSAVRLRVDVGTTKWKLDGDPSIDAVRLSRVDFTMVRALRAPPSFRISLYRGLGAGRYYYYSFRHATRSPAKKLGVHGLAGIEYIIRRRVAVGGEFQMAAVGTAYPFAGELMFTMRASIGVKVRL